MQTSCGFGVPQLDLTVDPETNEPKPCLTNRARLGRFAEYTLTRGELPGFHIQHNSRSLDGHPGLYSALRDKGEAVWWAKVRNCGSYYRHQFEIIKTVMAIMLLVMVVAEWTGYV